jgi:chromosome segregation ATPase
MSMHEIDRQHKVILTTQGGLQELVKSLKHLTMKHVVFNEEEEDDDSNDDLDHEVVTARLMENLKFQVRQLRVKAGVSDVSKTEIEESKQKHRMLVKELKAKAESLQDEKETLELDLRDKNEKIAFLTKENAALYRQCQKLQKIITKYNETHCGANFHLNAMDKPKEILYDKKLEKRYSTTSYDSSESTLSTVRERTYVEGDQLATYPSSLEESAIIKDRLKRSIYSARNGDYRSSNVAQCIRCQKLFKPVENTHKSCQFHHKGREIKEKFQENGKLEKVLYKWSCCKKPLDSPGCCYGFHI